VGRHQMKFGADFNHVKTTPSGTSSFPRASSFPNLTAFFSHTQRSFGFPMLKGQTEHPGFSLPFTQDVPTRMAIATLTSDAHKRLRIFCPGRMEIYAALRSPTSAL